MCLLVVLFLLDLLLFLLLDGVEGVGRDRVQSQNRLMSVTLVPCGTYAVWVLDEHILALRLLHAQVGNGTDDTPTVGKRDVHLSRKVLGLV